MEPKAQIIEHDGKRYKVIEMLAARPATPAKSEEEKFFDLWSDKAHCMKAVAQDGDALQYVKEQTPAICLKAVEQNGWALQYVKSRKTFDLIMKERRNCEG